MGEPNALGAPHVDRRYPSFRGVQSALPEPALIEVRPELRLETLHVDGPAPALVFLHGGLGNLWNPYLQLHHFHQQCELVTYSLAGNGGSNDRRIHSLDGHVQDLVDLLDTLSVSEPVLIGWSYGTALALEYAKRYPVQGLLLTGGAAFGLTPAWEKPILKLILALRLYKLMPSTWSLKKLAQFAAVHPETPEPVIEEVLKSNPLPRRRSAYKTVTDGFWGYDGRDDLDRIACPVLVVHGPADRIVPIEHARSTADLLPTGEFYRLERTGHVAPVERPATYNRLLESLVEATQYPERWPDNVRLMV